MIGKVIAGISTVAIGIGIVSSVPFLSNIISEIINEPNEPKSKIVLSNVLANHSGDLDCIANMDNITLFDSITGLPALNTKDFPYNSVTMDNIDKFPYDKLTIDDINNGSVPYTFDHNKKSDPSVDEIFDTFISKMELEQETINKEPVLWWERGNPNYNISNKNFVLHCNINSKLYQFESGWGEANGIYYLSDYINGRSISYKIPLSTMWLTNRVNSWSRWEFKDRYDDNATTHPCYCNTDLSVDDDKNSKINSDKNSKMITFTESWTPWVVNLTNNISFEQEPSNSDIINIFCSNSYNELTSENGHDDIEIKVLKKGINTKTHKYEATIMVYATSTNKNYFGYDVFDTYYSYI